MSPTEPPIESESGAPAPASPAASGAPKPRPELLRLDAEALGPAFFALLYFASLGGLVYVLSDFIPDIVMAFVLVGLLRRPFERLKQHWGGHAYRASAVTTLLGFVLVVAPLVYLFYVVAIEAASVYGHAAGLLGGPGTTRFDALIRSLGALGLPFSRQDILEGIHQLSTTMRSVVVDWGSELLSDALSLLLHVATQLVMVFYFLVDADRLRDFVFDLSPLPEDEDVLLVETFKSVSRGVIVGNGLGSLLQGLLGGLAMWVAGFESAIVWGVVMAVFAFLPLVGITVVTVPATLVLLFQGRSVAALAFFGFCTLQGLFIENIVKTRLMGSAMRMHDLLVFLSILGGIGAFGVIGLIYGPLLAMLFVTLTDLYYDRYRPQLARRFGHPPRRDGWRAPSMPPPRDWEAASSFTRSPPTVRSGELEPPKES